MYAFSDLAQPTLPGIITACATVITALGVFAGGLAVLLPQLKRLNQTVDEVHVIVNQQRTDAQRYQVALVHALNEAGIKVPIDQSLPVESD